MAGQWEVVGGKKHRNDTNKKNANHQKKNMPQLDDIVPIKESQTMFDAFLEKERKKALQESKANAIAVANKTKDGGSQPKKKNSDKKKNQPPVKAISLEDGIKALNVEEIKTQYASDVARFPDTPLIWLQDLATYANVKLDIEIPDPFFSSKPIGYPSSLMHKEIRQLFLDAIRHSPAQTHQLFFDFSLQSMIQDSVKGLNTVGHRIFLQFLAEEKPGIVLDSISKCIDFRNSYQNRQNVCLSILWAVGQAGNKNLEIGLKVWSAVMFPILGSKAYSKYVVEYLEKLVCSHKCSMIGQSVLPVQDLFSILDFIHSSSSLPAQLQKQFRELYPTLKALSYGSERQNVLRNYFPFYLQRLEPNRPAALKEEVLKSLLECLVLDKMSYSVWRQLYTKHLMQSTILITRLLDDWDELPSTFPKKLLSETLSAFQVTNEELVGQKQNVEECVAACNAVLNKMRTRPFPVLRVLFFACVLILSLLAYDVRQSGSFQSSKTGKFLKDSGALAVYDQAAVKVAFFTNKALRWLEVNFPIFQAFLQRTCGPYLHSFWAKVNWLSVEAWNSTKDVRSWASTNIPPILQVVSDSILVYINAASKYAESVIIQVSGHMFTAYKSAEHYTTEIDAWLHKNVFTGSLSTENLQKYAGNTVQAFQEYTMSTYNWISQYVSTIVSSGK